MTSTSATPSGATKFVGRLLAALFGLDALARGISGLGLLLEFMQPTPSQAAMFENLQGGALLAAKLGLLVWAVVSAAIAYGLFSWTRWGWTLAVIYYAVALAVAGWLGFTSGLGRAGVVVSVIAAMALIWLCLPASKAAYSR